MMMMPALLLGLVVVVAFFGYLFYVMSQNSGGGVLERRERAELEELRVLVDDLKETAWDHRELDSALSVILIDKIRGFEKRRRELGP